MTDNVKLDVSSSAATMVGTLDSMQQVNPGETSNTDKCHNGRAQQSEPRKQEQWQPVSLLESIANTRQTLDDEYAKFTNDLDSAEGAVELEELDYDALYAEYEAQNSILKRQEKELFNEFSNRFQQFQTWMQISGERENDRASKRLKTQAAFVQLSEHNLSKQQQHYDAVLEAFQKAMQLMNARD